MLSRQFLCMGLTVIEHPSHGGEFGHCGHNSLIFSIEQVFRVVRDDPDSSYRFLIHMKWNQRAS